MFSNASAVGSDAGIPTTCNHVNKPSEDFLSSGDKLPSVVQLGAELICSIVAPSLVVALFFVMLAMSSRREEEDEEEEDSRRIVEDETAVSPVIATILMVAITVVLSGVIYVWASSLQRLVVGCSSSHVRHRNQDIGTADGYWAITVDQTEVELATAAVTVTVLYNNADGVRTSYETLLQTRAVSMDSTRRTVMRSDIRR